MKYKTCCFSGHRMLPEDKIEQIKAVTEKYVRQMIIENDVRFFCAGGAIGFDMIAAETVLEMKKRYPEINLILVLPHADQAKYYSPDNFRRYTDIKMRADREIYISQAYYRGCLHERNRFMIDHSDYCIAYLTETSGGTVYTVRYGREKGIKIINTADEIK